MLHSQLTALGLAVAALVAAGCGSSSEDKSSSATTGTGASKTATSATNTSGTTNASPNATLSPVAVSIAAGKPLSRSRWIAKGDAICGDLNSKLDKLPPLNPREPRVLSIAAGYERVAVVQLSKIVPPASKTHDWERILSDTLQWAEGSAKLAEYGKLGDALTSSPIATATIEVRNHLTRLAKHDGFKVCSVEPT